MRTPRNAPFCSQISLREKVRAWFGRQQQRRLVEPKLWSDLAASAVFQGKSVALVGNAGYLADLDQGRKIDQFDLVIRMNNFRVTGFERQVGGKSDVLLTNFFRDIDFEHPDLHRVRTIISSSPNNFHKMRDIGIHLRHGQLITAGMAKLRRRELFVPPLDWFQRQIQLIGRYPSTGACGILLLLECLAEHCSEIYVTGFSFFACRSHYFPSSGADPTTNHDADRERTFLAQRLLPAIRSGRLSVDSTMARCIDASDLQEGAAA